MHPQIGSGELKENFLKIATLVQKAIHDSVQSLVRRNSERVQETFKKMGEINSIRISIDNVCMRLLAFGQPTVTDFRFISTAMKITVDLGKMSEQTVKIAEHALFLNPERQAKSYLDIPKMARIVQSMVKDVTSAFVNRDSNLARSVLQTDDLIDQLNDRVMRELLTYVTDDPVMITKVIHLMRVCRCLERIGDYAANIAEDVIFLIDALDHKHHADSGLNNRMSN